MAQLTRVSINNHNATVPESYSKSQVDTKLARKQDALTAGDNITIDQNGVISATGAGFATLSVRDEMFWNAAAYTIPAYDSVTVPITSGTVPAGYTFTGLRSFGAGNNHLDIVRVTPSSTVVRNPTANPITVAANTNYTERVYIKLQ